MTVISYLRILNVLYSVAHMLYVLTNVLPFLSMFLPLSRHKSVLFSWSLQFIYTMFSFYCRFSRRFLPRAPMSGILLIPHQFHFGRGRNRERMFVKIGHSAVSMDCMSYILSSVGPKRHTVVLSPADDE